MRRKIAAVLGVLLLSTTIVGCGNKQLIDTTYTFNRAIIELPNGDVIEGEVESWKDYDDGEQIQVKINGITYLVHSGKITLIKN